MSPNKRRAKIKVNISLDPVDLPKPKIAKPTPVLNLQNTTELDQEQPSFLLKTKTDPKERALTTVIKPQKSEPINELVELKP